MAWVKSDDREDDRRDIKRAWRANGESIGLRALARTYCARHETDGLVDADWLEDRIEDPGRREAVVRALLDNDLFVHLPAGEERTVKVTRTTSGKKVAVNVKFGPVDVDAYIMPDYLDHNDARVEAEARRREQARKKAAARGKKGKSNPSNVPSDIDACPKGQIEDNQDCPETQDVVSTLSRPDPTRPDPTLTKSLEPPQPPKGARSRDREKWRAELDEWVQANPTTSELIAEWEAVVADCKPATLMWTQHMHPHRLGEQAVLSGPDIAPLVRHDLERLIGPFVLVDCQCELAKQAAA